MKLTKREKMSIALGIPVEGVCPKCYNRLDIIHDNVGDRENPYYLTISKCYSCGWGDKK